MREFNRFIPKKSHAAADEQDTGNLEGMPKLVTGQPTDLPIPPCPTCQPGAMMHVEYYFGKLWWLWLVALFVYLLKK